MVPPEPIGSVPQIAVDQVTVQIHRHRRGRMPSTRWTTLGRHDDDRRGCWLP